MSGDRPSHAPGRWLLKLRAGVSRFQRPPEPTADLMATYSGGCHCRRVRFEVRAPARLTLLECNCSICSMVAYLHLVVPVSNFRLQSGDDVLTTYRFLTRTAEHTFCSLCGIKPFYVPRADPFSRSINARCLDGGPGMDSVILSFDGKRWGQPGGRI